MQLGMFDEEDFDDVDAPIYAECICPRCRAVRIESDIMPGVRRLRILCEECKRLEEGSDARISYTYHAPATYTPAEVVIYRKGEIPRELIELYRRP